jgi:hypothetical protein
MIVALLIMYRGSTKKQESTYPQQSSPEAAPLVQVRYVPVQAKHDFACLQHAAEQPMSVHHSLGTNLRKTIERITLPHHGI